MNLISTKYGLDSEIVASFCESFATHVDLPKEKWFKYHPPIEVKVVEPIKVEEKTVTYNDPIVPTAYVEKPPFPVRIKDHAKASTVVRKSNISTYTPPEQVKVEPNIAIVKDLLADNIDGHVIYFFDCSNKLSPQRWNIFVPVRYFFGEIIVPCFAQFNLPAFLFHTSDKSIYHFIYLPKIHFYNI